MGTINGVIEIKLGNKVPGVICVPPPDVVRMRTLGDVHRMVGPGRRKDIRLQVWDYVV